MAQRLKRDSAQAEVSTTSESGGVRFSAQAGSIEPPSLRQITTRIMQSGGINLGQGTCQLPVPPEVLAAAHSAMDKGVNRYTNPIGLLSLRQAISQKLARDNGFVADPETEILITNGTTGAIEGFCATLLNPGDAVVSFSPYYPYHDNAFKRFQAERRYVPLNAPNWEIDWNKFEEAIDSRVKFVLVNTPGNPTGKVFNRDELLKIGNMCRKHGIFLVTDEIYEYMTYDTHAHLSPASILELADITITMGGYSKTFAITGWRIGYLIARKEVMERLSILVDNIYVCAPAPLQQGVAEAITQLPESFYRELRAMYQRKRDYFCSVLEKVGLKVVRPQGAYYVMADFSSLYSNMSAREFVDVMIEKTNVGAVPSDDFVPDSRGQSWVRFCFALPDADLERAAGQLQKLVR